jgi:hypothetical protein
MEGWGGWRGWEERETNHAIGPHVEAKKKM